MKKQILILILVLAIILHLFAACSRCTDFPEHGIWHCEDLHMTLTLVQGETSTYEVNGEMVTVELGLYYDMHTLDVFRDNDGSKIVFCGRCVSVSENQMEVVDLSDGRNYSFTRIVEAEEST